MDISGLSILNLRAVAAVAAHGHFGRAAESLRMAQPTLSAHVQKVERALGATLFERAARRFLVTPEGHRLLPLLREVLGAAERVREGAAAGAAGPGGAPLRLGIIPTLGPYLMPHLLLPLSRARRGPSLSIAERQTAQVVEAVLDGSLDAAIVSLPVRGESLECVPLFDEPFRLIAPRGSRIACGGRLAPSSLRACDMILLEDGHCLRQQALSVCGRRGGTTPRLVASGLETLKYLVAAGEGYSLLPMLACDLPRGLAGLVEIRAFDDRSPSRRVGICYRRSLARRDGVLGLAEFIRRHPPPGVTVARPGR